MQVLSNKITELARMAQLITVPQPVRSGADWDYINEVCPNETANE